MERQRIRMGIKKPVAPCNWDDRFGFKTEHSRGSTQFDKVCLPTPSTRMTDNGVYRATILRTKGILSSVPATSSERVSGRSHTGSACSLLTLPLWRAARRDVFSSSPCGYVIVISSIGGNSCGVNHGRISKKGRPTGFTIAKSRRSTVNIRGVCVLSATAITVASTKSTRESAYLSRMSAARCQSDSISGTIS